MQNALVHTLLIFSFSPMRHNVRVRRQIAFVTTSGKSPLRTLPLPPYLLADILFYQTWQTQNWHTTLFYISNQLQVSGPRYLNVNKLDYVHYFEIYIIRILFSVRLKEPSLPVHFFLLSLSFPLQTLKHNTHTWTGHESREADEFEAIGGGLKNDFKVYIMEHNVENQMLFTELKNLSSFSRYFDLKFWKYRGLYGESKL